MITITNAELKNAVLRVGDSRGFVVERQHYLSGAERIVITAAHCLPRLPPPYEQLLQLPTPHPMRCLHEGTYSHLLGPLGADPTVWAECLFVDPVADIAVLGQPDGQELYEEAETYDRLVDDMTALKVADAPPPGLELIDGVGGHKFKNPTPGKGSACVLSLEGHWIEGSVERRRSALAFKPEKAFVGGMSGSPIIDGAGAAIGVVSVDMMSPVIVDALSALLVRSLLVR
jgi:hypothetical protein